MGVATPMGVCLRVTENPTTAMLVGERGRFPLLAAAAIAFLLAATTLGMAATHVLIITGPGGDSEYDQLFSKWATQLGEQLQPRAAAIVSLGPGAQNPSTRTEVLSTLAKYQTLEPADLFLFFVIGHGSSDREDYRLNLPGPDLTAQELKAALDKIRAQVVVVNGTSCSGASLSTLSAKNRAVITATRSGRETTPPRFVGFLVEGLDGRADADKNGAISLLELFQYARKHTAEWYQSQNRLASEHALLDDSGSGRGTDNPVPGSADGALAASLMISRPELQAEARVPAELLRRKQELEAGIEKLRFQKSQMSEADYQEQFEGLLLELARINRQIAGGH